jgi:hypothetical protein
MLIDVDQAQDTVVEKEHVEIAAGRTQETAHPCRAAVTKILAPEILDA